MKSVGQQLRDERLKQGLSLKSLSMNTKIREDQLLKIERDEFNKLHGPTYVRGFVRNYATALGLDVRTLLSELEHLLEMEGENSYLSLGVINYLPEETKPKREFRPQSLFLGLAGVLLLMILGVFIYKIYQIGFVSARTTAPVTSATEKPVAVPKGGTTTIKKAPLVLPLSMPLRTTRAAINSP
jgi:cytoskeleton protein RodZ